MLLRMYSYEFMGVPMLCTVTSNRTLRSFR